MKIEYIIYLFISHDKNKPVMLTILINWFCVWKLFSHCFESNEMENTIESYLTPPPQKKNNKNKNKNEQIHKTNWNFVRSVALF